MDNEKEIVWTDDMGFMPPVVKTEGRTICRQECQLTEYKQEIERLREALQQIKSYRYSNYENAIQNFNDLQNIASAALKEGE